MAKKKKGFAMFHPRTPTFFENKRVENTKKTFCLDLTFFSTNITKINLFYQIYQK